MVQKKKCNQSKATSGHQNTKVWSSSQTNTLKSQPFTRTGKDAKFTSSTARTNSLGRHQRWKSLSLFGFGSTSMCPPKSAVILCLIWPERRLMQWEIEARMEKNIPCGLSWMLWKFCFFPPSAKIYVQKPSDGPVGEWVSPSSSNRVQIRECFWSANGETKSVGKRVFKRKVVSGF